MIHLLKGPTAKWAGLAAGMLLLAVSFLSSIAFGQTSIPFKTAIRAFTHYDADSAAHVIIMTSRLTRALLATAIGASLAVAGTLMQALTRNPLASPSVFGINAGAVFFVVLMLAFFPATSLSSYMWMAFLGAGIAAALVYALGSLGKDGLSPLKIVLAGAAISALFVSMTQGLLVINEQNLESALFWLAGSVAGRSLDMLRPIAPLLAAGWLAALLLGKAVNLLVTGEDIAKGLGQRTVLVKAAMAIVIIVLAGGSVAVGGSIGFVGLVVPHIVRGLVGTDHRWIIPYCLVLGASLLLLADVASRFLLAPQGLPIGVVTAFLGTPFFIYLARRGFHRE
ncbi:iron ABC transporter permease [Gorillibacterium sp. CAU 1737]|uniref:FecCD family ABC transporter permease n=1 Tax=Gorillibacterium sp. CAU 1737 TaxID=3140362 RepID=UPI0032607282